MQKILSPIMFHHFHDFKKHKKSQGSITRDKFYKLLKKIGLKNILSPHQYLYKIKNKRINSFETCLTFDDGIKSQYDIAFPIIKELKLSAFFFIYTSIFEKKINFLEINRYFREVYFKNVDKYYEEFYRSLKKDYDFDDIKRNIDRNKRKIINQKKIHNFYSLSDLRFRYMRDNILGEQKFNNISKKLFKKFNFDYKNISKNLYMKRNDLKNLIKHKNVIGLHSHSHQTSLDKLPYNLQFKEFKENKIKIEKITNQKVFSLAYPLGKFNSDSLKMAKKLDIELAFLSNAKLKKKNNLLLPREDHTIASNKLFKQKKKYQY